MAEEYDYKDQYYSNFLTKIRDIEEKQRILKDRLLLIGENLVELKEKKLVIEINKNPTGLPYLKRQRWRLSNEAFDAYSKYQPKDQLHL